MKVRKAAASARALLKHSGTAAGVVPSASSRLLQFGLEFRALKEAAGGVLEDLQLDAPIPENLHDLSVRLDGAPAGINKQVEMATQGGSDMALALVKSWYPEVKVDILTGGFRTGTSLESLGPGILMASRRIAKAVDLTQLVPGEPSPAVRPTEDVGTDNVTAATDSALP